MVTSNATSANEKSPRLPVGELVEAERHVERHVEDAAVPLEQVAREDERSVAADLAPRLDLDGHDVVVVETEGCGNKKVYERNYRVFKKLYKSNAVHFRALNSNLSE